MSLGDHLEELRARLILAILGLLVGTVICLFFGRLIIDFIEQPYNKIIKEHEQKKIEKELQENETGSNYLLDSFCENLVQALKSDPNAPAIDPNVVKFVQSIYVNTIKELAEDTNYITELTDSLNSSNKNRLIILAPADPFVGFMKISLISGLIISSPWVFYQLWMFVAAGLYTHERRYVRIAVPFSTALFVIGALFFLFVVAPISLGFFLGFGDWIGVSSNWTFQKYISFVTTLMLVFGLGFQTPIAIFVLNRTGLVSIESLQKSRKYVIVGMFALAAFVTPPDIVSQITLGVPLCALFELGILMSWLAERKKQAKENQNSQENQGDQDSKSSQENQD
jgi:sec-independent protein translocase protein TatC